MTYFLNDTVTGPYSGNVFAKKGDTVILIAEHGNVSIVEKDGVRFTAPTLKLSKKEVEQDSSNIIWAEPEYKPSFSRARGSKKTVTNPTNNIQSLF